MPSDETHAGQSTTFLERAADAGRAIVKQTMDATANAADAVKANPVLNRIVLAALGFAIGALWRGGRSKASRSERRTWFAEAERHVPWRWRA
jgi:hypothetical protein